MLALKLAPFPPALGVLDLESAREGAREEIGEAMADAGVDEKGEGRPPEGLEGAADEEEAKDPTDGIGDG